MRLSTIGYCFKQGFLNIWRNKLFSLASVATMAACIFMFGIFFCIVENFQHFVREAEEGVAVTVLFNEGTSEDQIMELGEELLDRDEVSKVVYVSAEEAWKSYQEIYFEGDPEAAEAFVDDNPLANSANLEIYMKDVSLQQNLVDYLESIDIVRKGGVGKEFERTELENRLKELEVEVAELQKEKMEYERKLRRKESVIRYHKIAEAVSWAITLILAVIHFLFE